MGDEHELLGWIVPGDFRHAGRITPQLAATIAAPRSTTTAATNAGAASGHTARASAAARYSANAAASYSTGATARDAPSAAACFRSASRIFARCTARAGCDPSERQRHCRRRSASGRRRQHAEGDSTC